MLGGETLLIVNLALAYCLAVNLGMAYLENIAVPPCLEEVVDQGVQTFWKRQVGHHQILNKESESAHKGRKKAERKRNPK